MCFRSIVVLVALLAGTALALSSTPAAAQETCFGRPATINGASSTSGPDVIIGTPNRDEINPREGEDFVCGVGGDDLLSEAALNGNLPTHDSDHYDGGEGNDTLRGVFGPDEFFGGPGDDTIDGGLDPATADGGPGNDEINIDEGQASGGEGNDAVGGNAALVDGGPGNDYVGAGPGGEALGGPGDDVLRAIGASIDGGPGEDTCAPGKDGTFANCELLQEVYFPTDPDRTLPPQIKAGRHCTVTSKFGYTINAPFAANFKLALQEADGSRWTTVESDVDRDRSAEASSKSRSLGGKLTLDAKRQSQLKQGRWRVQATFRLRGTELPLDYKKHFLRQSEAENLTAGTC